MSELRNITSVELKNTPSQTENVLVEDSGVAKRVPINKIGGSDELIVIFSYDDEDNVVCDTEPSEIRTAFNAKKNVRAYFQYGEEGEESLQITYFLAGCYSDDCIEFVSSIEERTWTINGSGSDDDYVWEKIAWSNVPRPTTSKLGKVLTVNGNPGVEWADVPKELPATLGTAGQVLKVNSDATGVEWGNAGGSGAEKFVVTFSEERWSSEYECYLVDSDKSIKEIYQAYSQGKIVEGIQDFGSYKYIYQLEMCGHESGEYSIGFVTNYEYSGRKNMFCFGCNDENNKEFLYVGISSLELPHHDIEDVGKVLTVNYNGGDVEWKTPSGGGSIPDAIITCYDNGSGGTWTVSCNKTYNELKTIIQNHGRIQMQHRHVYEANAYFIDDVSYCIMDNSDIIFQAVTPDAPSYTGKLLRYMIKVTSENVWTWDFSRFINTPTYNSSDANKVLKVNNNATEVEWGNAGGGDNVLIVTGTFDDIEEEETEGTLSNVSHTYAQIKAAFDSGKIIAFKNIDEGTVYPLTELTYYASKLSDSEATFFFTGAEERWRIGIGYDASDNYWAKSHIEEFPYYDEDNIGQVLTIKHRDNDDLTYPYWADVPKELPTRPTTDGTYVLKCTVTGGTAALSWVADT